MPNKLIKSIKPLAHILKVDFIDDESVFGDELENFTIEVDACKENMEQASLSQVKGIYQKIREIVSNVYSNRNTVEI